MFLPLGSNHFMVSISVELVREIIHISRRHLRVVLILLLPQWGGVELVPELFSFQVMLKLKIEPGSVLPYFYFIYIA